MVKETKTKKIICPRCRGNGFFKVKESVQNPKDKVVQCPMCKSQGEVNENKDDTMFIDADGIHRLH